MPIASSKIPSVVTSPVKHDQIDLEPNDMWKDAPRKRIEEGLKSMIDDATRARDNQLVSTPPNDPRQEGIREDYDTVMNNIANLTKEAELERERQERRWSIGGAMMPQWDHVFKSEKQEIMDRIKETQKENSSLDTSKGLDELWSVESGHVHEGRPASREAITNGIFRPPITEATDQAWTLSSTTSERGMQRPPSPSESQSTIPYQQQGASSSYSGPSSSGGGQQSDAMGRPLPNISNSKASVLSLQDQDQAAYPPPAWPISKASFNDDRDHPATARHPSGRLGHQPEPRRSPWLGATQPFINPSQRRPSENRPAFVQETSFDNHPSYAAPEGLSILF